LIFLIQVLFTKEVVVGLYTLGVVVSHISLFSPNMEKTAEFYRALGVRLQRSVHGWGPHYHYGDVLENNGVHTIFDIYSLDPEQKISPQSLGFSVKNLGETIKKLLEIGAPLERPAILKRRPELYDKTTYAVFRDPDGRMVSLNQLKPAK